MGTKVTASADLDVTKEEKAGLLREVGNQAVWSLSSCKPGKIILNIETYWSLKHVQFNV